MESNQPKIVVFRSADGCRAAQIDDLSLLSGVVDSLSNGTPLTGAKLLEDIPNWAQSVASNLNPEENTWALVSRPSSERSVEKKKKLKLSVDDTAFMEGIAEKLAELDLPAESIDPNLLSEYFAKSEASLKKLTPSIDFGDDDVKNHVKYLLCIRMVDRIFNEHLERLELEEEEALEAVTSKTNNEKSEPKNQWNPEVLTVTVGNDVEEWMRLNNHSASLNEKKISFSLRRTWGFSPKVRLKCQSESSGNSRHTKTPSDRVTLSWKGPVIKVFTLAEIKSLPEPLGDNIYDFAWTEIHNWLTHEELGKYLAGIENLQPHLIYNFDNSITWTRAKLFTFCREFLKSGNKLTRLDIILETLTSSESSEPTPSLIRKAEMAMAPLVCAPFATGTDLRCVVFPLTVEEEIRQCMNGSPRPSEQWWLSTSLLIFRQKAALLVPEDLYEYLRAEIKGPLTLTRSKIPSHLSVNILKTLEPEPILSHNEKAGPSPHRVRRKDTAASPRRRRRVKKQRKP